MSIRGSKDWRRWRRSLAACGLLVGLLVSGTPAGAAQIDITNCQPQQVRICALDGGDVDPVTGQVFWELAGQHIFSEGETHHFTCHANCKFWITEHCSDGDCSGCSSDHGHWLDHSWGKGAYQLISLEQNSSNNYKSADLKKVDAGAACP